MLSNDAKNEAADGITVDLISLHDDNPGSDGTENELEGSGYERKAASFSPAVDGERYLAENVEFSGPPNSSVTWFALWEAGEPDIFKGRGQITSGDVSFNAAGEFILTTGTVIKVIDPV